MDTEQEIYTIADTHLLTAEQLLLEGSYLRAIYLGGYAVELYLKAKIVQLLDLPDLYAGRYDTSILRVYKTHDFNQLVLLAGLHRKLDAELKVNPNLQSSWYIVCKWSEQLRYEKEDVLQYNLLTAQSFIQSVKDITQWIIKQ